MLVVTACIFCRPANRCSRVAFCKKYMDYDFSNVVFLDGVTVVIKHFGSACPTFAWRRVNDPEPTEFFQSGRSFHVYGAVSAKGKTNLVLIDRKAAFNAERFQLDVLLPITRWGDATYGAGNWKLVADHARQHTAKSTQKFIEEHQVPWLDAWPAQAQDLNIIENIWGCMKRQIAKFSTIKNTDKSCWQHVQRAWQEIEQQTIDNCIADLPRRMQKIIDIEGKLLC